MVFFVIVYLLFSSFCRLSLIDLSVRYQRFYHVLINPCVTGEVNKLRFYCLIRTNFFEISVCIFSLEGCTLNFNLCVSRSEILWTCCWLTYLLAIQLRTSLFIFFVLFHLESLTRKYELESSSDILIGQKVLCESFEYTGKPAEERQPCT
jgi:hypothetical protein